MLGPKQQRVVVPEVMVPFVAHPRESFSMVNGYQRFTKIESVED